MTKISNTSVYGFQSPISLEDFWIGTDGLSNNKKTKSFRARDIVDLVLAEMGQPNSGIRLVGIVATETGLSIQSDWLKDATQIKTLITNNQTFTDFSGFPDFELDKEEGIISGFPVEENQEIIVIYATTPSQEEIED